MCGALAMRAPSALKIAQEKSSRSLMLTLVAVAWSATPISSAMAMNRLLKISSRTGSTSVPIALPRSSGAARVSTSVPSLARSPRQPGSTTIVEVASKISAGPMVPPRICGGGVSEADGGGHSHRLRRSPSPRNPGRSSSDRLHHQGIDDDLGTLIDIAEATLVQLGEVAAHALRRRDGNIEGRVAPGRSKPGAAHQLDAVSVHALLPQRLASPLFQFREGLAEILSKRLQPARLADRLHVGDADAIGRQHAGKRMDEDAFHSERIGYPAGVLASSAAEAGKRILRDVMAPSDRDLADRRCHVVDGDVEKAFGDVFERLAVAELVGDFLQAPPRSVGIERLVSGWTEHRREMIRIDPAKEEVAVGHGQRATVAVASRAWICAGAFRPHAETHSVEPADRAAAGRDGVDLHHRRADPHPGDDALVGELEAAGVMRTRRSKCRPCRSR